MVATGTRRGWRSIKAAHGEQATINVFPAPLVAAAVEVGRVWMPKANLPFVIYDQNRRMGGLSGPFHSIGRGPTAGGPPAANPLCAAGKSAREPQKTCGVSNRRTRTCRAD